MIPKQGLFHILYPDCFIVVFILCEAQYLWYLRKPLTYGVCWMKRLSRVIPLSSSIWNPKNIRFRISILYLCDIICLHHLFLPCVPPTNLFTVYFLTKSHFSWGKAVWSLAANGSIALMAPSFSKMKYFALTLSCWGCCSWVHFKNAMSSKQLHWFSYNGSLKFTVNILFRNLLLYVFPFDSLKGCRKLPACMPVYCKGMEFVCGLAGTMQELSETRPGTIHAVLLSLFKEGYICIRSNLEHDCS